MSQERKLPINNLINAAEVHNKFYGGNRELFEWVKASEELPSEFTRTPAMIKGLIGTITIGQYKNISLQSGLHSWRCDIGDSLLKNVEWLKPITKTESISENSIEQMAEEIRQLKEIRNTYNQLNSRLSEELRTANGKIYELEMVLKNK